MAEPIKNRTDVKLTRAYTKKLNELKKAGYKPRVHWLDNEEPPSLKQYDEENQVMYQLTPPHMHRINAAEWAIYMFKEHFVVGLCSTDPNFPMHLLCWLTTQAEISLNLFQQCQKQPKLSAYTAVWGNFDYNRTLLALPGSRIIVHEKPGQRGSWDPHSVSGWYIGPDMEHYRCFTVYCPTSKAERIGDTIDFFLPNMQLPHVMQAEAATQAAIELTEVLKAPTPKAIFETVGSEKLEAIEKLAEIFKQHTKPKVSVPTAMVEEKSPAKEKSQPSPRLEEISTKIKPTVPNTRLAKPGDPHN
eukprot:3951872-Ditylum_brightwellii.AAC.1